MWGYATWPLDAFEEVLVMPFPPVPFEEEAETGEMLDEASLDDVSGGGGQNQELPSREIVIPPVILKKGEL